MSKLQDKYFLIRRLESLGFTFDEAQKLRRIEMTLSRWGELECGGSNDYASWAIERDEKTDKPYMVRHIYSDKSGKVHRSPIADREKGALRRLDAIMATHPALISYHQGDPRGCCLYIVPRKAIANGDISSCYTNGIAVCA